MYKLVAVYNRKFLHLSSSGPDDPNTTIYAFDEDQPYPADLIKADAVRFLATEIGGVIWTATKDVSKSISTDGEVMKPDVLLNCRRAARYSTLKALSSYLKKAE